MEKGVWKSLKALIMSEFISFVLSIFSNIGLKKPKKVLKYEEPLIQLEINYLKMLVSLAITLGQVY